MNKASPVEAYIAASEEFAQPFLRNVRHHRGEEIFGACGWDK